MQRVDLKKNQELVDVIKDDLVKKQSEVVKIEEERGVIADQCKSMSA